MNAAESLRQHWPEYLIEGWALGTFMVSAGVFGVLLEAPGSLIREVVADPTTRRVLAGIAMGITAILLIYSPWGQRSGAHMNPAVTLTFLRLGKIARWDAMFFIAAQFIGGTLGVLLVAAVVGSAFIEPPVHYVVTVPGPSGSGVAFLAELVISAVLMLAILVISNTPRLARYTGIIAGCLVAAYISIEAPLSGMSMNPARSFASALPAQQWQGFWIYLTAPVLGMLAAAQLHRRTHCAKLQHPDDQRCIHCAYQPAAVPAATDLRNGIAP